MIHTHNNLRWERLHSDCETGSTERAVDLEGLELLSTLEMDDPVIAIYYQPILACHSNIDHYQYQQLLANK